MAGAADLTVCEASIYARTLSCQVTCARRPVVTDRAARGVHSIADILVYRQVTVQPLK